MVGPKADAGAGQPLVAAGPGRCHPTRHSTQERQVEDEDTFSALWHEQQAELANAPSCEDWWSSGTSTICTSPTSAAAGVSAATSDHSQRPFGAFGQQQAHTCDGDATADGLPTFPEVLAHALRDTDTGGAEAVRWLALRAGTLMVGLAAWFTADPSSSKAALMPRRWTSATCLPVPPPQAGISRAGVAWIGAGGEEGAADGDVRAACVAADVAHEVAAVCGRTCSAVMHPADLESLLRDLLRAALHPADAASAARSLAALLDCAGGGSTQQAAAAGAFAALAALARAGWLDFRTLPVQLGVGVRERWALASSFTELMGALVVRYREVLAALQPDQPPQPQPRRGRLWQPAPADATRTGADALAAHLAAQPGGDAATSLCHRLAVLVQEAAAAAASDPAVAPPADRAEAARRGGAAHWPVPDWRDARDDARVADMLRSVHASAAARAAPLAERELGSSAEEARAAAEDAAVACQQLLRAVTDVTAATAAAKRLASRLLPQPQEPLVTQGSGPSAATPAAPSDPCPPRACRRDGCDVVQLTTFLVLEGVIAAGFLSAAELRVRLRQASGTGGGSLWRRRDAAAFWASLLELLSRLAAVAAVVADAANDARHSAEAGAAEEEVAAAEAGANALDSHVHGRGDWRLGQPDDGPGSEGAGAEQHEGHAGGAGGHHEALRTRPCQHRLQRSPAPPCPLPQLCVEPQASPHAAATSAALPDHGAAAAASLAGSPARCAGAAARRRAAEGRYLGAGATAALGGADAGPPLVPAAPPDGAAWCAHGGAAAAQQGPSGGSRAGHSGVTGGTAGAQSGNGLGAACRLGPGEGATQSPLQPPSQDQQQKQSDVAAYTKACAAPAAAAHGRPPADTAQHHAKNTPAAGAGLAVGVAGGGAPQLEPVATASAVADAPAAQPPRAVKPPARLAEEEPRGLVGSVAPAEEGMEAAEDVEPPAKRRWSSKKWKIELNSTWAQRASAALDDVAVPTTWAGVFGSAAAEQARTTAAKHQHGRAFGALAVVAILMCTPPAAPQLASAQQGGQGGVPEAGQDEQERPTQEHAQAGTSGEGAAAGPSGGAGEGSNGKPAQQLPTRTRRSTVPAGHRRKKQRISGIVLEARVRMLQTVSALTAGAATPPPGYAFVVLLMQPSFGTFERTLRQPAPAVVLHLLGGRAVCVDELSAAVRALGPNTQADWESVLFVRLSSPLPSGERVVPLGAWRAAWLPEVDGALDLDTPCAGPASGGSAGAGGLVGGSGSPAGAEASEGGGQQAAPDSGSRPGARGGSGGTGRQAQHAEHAGVAAPPQAQHADAAGPSGGKGPGSGGRGACLKRAASGDGQAAGPPSAEPKAPATAEAAAPEAVPLPEARGLEPHGAGALAAAGRPRHKPPPEPTATPAAVVQEQGAGSAGGSMTAAAPAAAAAAAVVVAAAAAVTATAAATAPGEVPAAEAAARAAADEMAASPRPAAERPVVEAAADLRGASAAPGAARMHTLEAEAEDAEGRDGPEAEEEERRTAPPAASPPASLMQQEAMDTPAGDTMLLNDPGGMAPPLAVAGQAPAAGGGGQEADAASTGSVVHMAQPSPRALAEYGQALRMQQATGRQRAPPFPASIYEAYMEAALAAGASSRLPPTAAAPGDAPGAAPAAAPAAAAAAAAAAARARPGDQWKRPGARAAQPPAEACTPPRRVREVRFAGVQGSPSKLQPGAAPAAPARPAATTAPAPCGSEATAENDVAAPPSAKVARSTAACPLRVAAEPAAVRAAPPARRGTEQGAALHEAVAASAARARRAAPRPVAAPQLPTLPTTAPTIHGEPRAAATAAHGRMSVAVAAAQQAPAPRSAAAPPAGAAFEQWETTGARAITAAAHLSAPAAAGAAALSASPPVEDAAPQSELQAAPAERVAVPEGESASAAAAAPQAALPAAAAAAHAEAPGAAATAAQRVSPTAGGAPRAGPQAAPPEAAAGLQGPDVREAAAAADGASPAAAIAGRPSLHSPFGGKSGERDPPRRTAQSAAAAAPDAAGGSEEGTEEHASEGDGKEPTSQDDDESYQSTVIEPSPAPRAAAAAGKGRHGSQQAAHAAAAAPVQQAGAAAGAGVTAPELPGPEAGSANAQVHGNAARTATPASSFQLVIRSAATRGRAAERGLEGVIVLPAPPPQTATPERGVTFHVRYRADGRETTGPPSAFLRAAGGSVVSWREGLVIVKVNGAPAEAGRTLGAWLQQAGYEVAGKAKRRRSSAGPEVDSPVG